MFPLSGSSGLCCSCLSAGAEGTIDNAYVYRWGCLSKSAKWVAGWNWPPLGARWIGDLLGFSNL